MTKNNKSLKTKTATHSKKVTPPPASAHTHYRSRIYTSDININPLIAACDQLLSLVAAAKAAELPDDNTRLLQDLAHEIRAFEHRAQKANYDPDTINAAQYALCSLLDESISSTPWGQKNEWSKKNLLSLFHNESDGSSHFFSIIDDALENTAKNMHLLELLYLFLNFGFTGKYKETPNEQNELLALSNKLYQIIGQQSHRNPKNILINEIKTVKQKSNIIPETIININTKKLFGIAAATAIIISGIIYLGVSIKLDNISNQIYTSIEQIQNNKNED
ncbi:MAG: type IVB secretion system protein IcmH/DotU [Gammaproteobacteria bacterium]|nr:type IVB secretion system protein IcmH/DotU [Gammaproteobacteria bacterium]